MDESFGLPAGTLENLGTGLGANIITVFAVAMLMCIRNCSKRKFKHSACNFLCCSLELDEPESESDSISKTIDIIDKGTNDVKKQHRHKAETV